MFSTMKTRYREESSMNNNKNNSYYYLKYYFVHFHLNDCYMIMTV